MMRRLTAALTTLAVVVGFSGCSYLRQDDEQFVLDITIEQIGNKVIFSPSKFVVNHHYGRVNLLNNTSQRRGFAIDDLAEYQDVGRRRAKTFELYEMKKGRTYVFYESVTDSGAKGFIKFDPSAEQRQRALDPPGRPQSQQRPLPSGPTGADVEPTTTSTP